MMMNQIQQAMAPSPLMAPMQMQPAPQADAAQPAAPGGPPGIGTQNQGKGSQAIMSLIKQLMGGGGGSIGAGAADGAGADAMMMMG